jgi:RND family efflux transporter MFP subunit
VSDSKQRRGIRPSTVIVATAVAAAAAFGAWRVHGAAHAPVALGRIVIVHRGDVVVRVSENGTLEPVTQVDVKSKVAGRLEKITVKEGDHVSAGQLLALVDPTEITWQVDGLQAQLAAARAGLQQAEENYLLTKTTSALTIARSAAAMEEAKRRLVQTAAPTRRQDIEQQETAVLRADAQVADARRTLARKQMLLDKGFVPQTDVDTAQTALALDEADAASARQHLSLLKEGARPEDVAVAQATVHSAQVQLASDQANAAQTDQRLQDVIRARADVAQDENQLSQTAVQLHDTRIVAPMSGEVIGKYLEEGELVASATAGFAQGAAIVRIANLAHMEVKVNINEVDVARLRVGLPVEIHVDGVPDQTFHGTVTAIAPSSLEADGSSSSAASSGSVVRFAVKIAVTDADKRLRPGMTAAVDILLDRRAHVLTLPAESLQSGDKVTVVTGAGDAVTKTTRSVTVGLRTDSTVEIRSGVKENDRIEVPAVSAPDRRKVDVNGGDGGDGGDGGNN